jgi:hypothetical protein
VKKRLEKLQRIERLQRRLHDLSVWRLATLGRQRDQLTNAHLEMLDAVGTGLLAFGPPAAAATRRIRSLEVEITVAKGGYEEQAKRSLEQGVRSRLADRAREAAAADLRADLEKRTLSELIEWSLQRPTSGSRKA